MSARDMAPHERAFTSARAFSSSAHKTPLLGDSRSARSSQAKARWSRVACSAIATT